MSSVGVVASRILIGALVLGCAAAESSGQPACTEPDQDSSSGPQIVLGLAGTQLRGHPVVVLGPMSRAARSGSGAVERRISTGEAAQPAEASFSSPTDTQRSVGTPNTSALVWRRTARWEYRPRQSRAYHPKHSWKCPRRSRYQPIRSANYQPKRSWTYHSKRSWRYNAERRRLRANIRAQVTAAGLRKQGWSAARLARWLGVLPEEAVALVSGGTSPSR